MKISPLPQTVIPQPAPIVELDLDDDQEQLFDLVPEAAPQDLTHTWVVAATVAVDPKIAKHSFLRGSFTTTHGQRIDALEVYCSGCRRPWDEVADEDCSAKIDNTHLIGGDPGVRKKRKVADNEGIGTQWAPAPMIQRYGIGAVVHGDA